MPNLDSTTLLPRTKDITGQTFGRLQVIAFAGYRAVANGEREARWLCLCTCGTQNIIGLATSRLVKTQAAAVLEAKKREHSLRLMVEIILQNIVLGVT